MALPDAFADFADSYVEKSNAFEFSVADSTRTGTERMVVRVHVIRRRPAYASIGRYGPRGGWHPMGLGGDRFDLIAQARIMQQAVGLTTAIEERRLKAEREGWE